MNKRKHQGYTNLAQLNVYLLQALDFFGLPLEPGKAVGVDMRVEGDQLIFSHGKKVYRTVHLNSDQL